MRILVTGGAGFIGTNLCNELRERGHRVITCDLFNKFLASNGKGKLIRNGAIASGIVSLIGYFVFIRIYGTMGAVITKLIAALIYLIFMLFYYKKSQ